MYWGKLAQLLRPKARRGATAQSQRQTDRLLLLPSYPNGGFISCVCGKHNKTQADKAKGQHSSWKNAHWGVAFIEWPVCGLGAWMENGNGCGSQAVAPRGKISRSVGVEKAETRFVHRCQCQSVATTAACHICSGKWRGWPRKSRQNRQMQRIGEWQHPKRVICRGVATSILWVVCVSVGYVVRICLAGWCLYMRSQSATKNSQQNVKWNCSATRSVCCYCLLCCHLRCCCMQHTHRYADTFLEIQSRSAARDHSDSWSDLPLALWFMRAAQIHIHIYIYSWQTQSQFLSVYFGISRIKFNFLLELWANKRGKVFLESCEIVNACRRP